MLNPNIDKKIVKNDSPAIKEYDLSNNPFYLRDSQIKNLKQQLLDLGKNISFNTKLGPISSDPGEENITLDQFKKNIENKLVQAESQKQELEELRNEAKLHGDVSENAEYTSAQENLQNLYSLIDALQSQYQMVANNYNDKTNLVSREFSNVSLGSEGGTYELEDPKDINSNLLLTADKVTSTSGVEQSVPGMLVDQQHANEVIKNKQALSKQISGLPFNKVMKMYEDMPAFKVNYVLGKNGLPVKYDSGIYRGLNKIDVNNNPNIVFNEDGTVNMEQTYNKAIASGITERYAGGGKIDNPFYMMAQQAYNKKLDSLKPRAVSDNELKLEMNKKIQQGLLGLNDTEYVAYLDNLVKEHRSKKEKSESKKDFELQGDEINLVEQELTKGSSIKRNLSNPNMFTAEGFDPTDYSEGNYNGTLSNEATSNLKLTEEAERDINYYTPRELINWVNESKYFGVKTGINPYTGNRVRYEGSHMLPGKEDLKEQATKDYGTLPYIKYLQGSEIKFDTYAKGFGGIGGFTTIKGDKIPTTLATTRQIDRALKKSGIGELTAHEFAEKNPDSTLVTKTLTAEQRNPTQIDPEEFSSTLDNKTKDLWNTTEIAKQYPELASVPVTVGTIDVPKLKLHKNFVTDPDDIIIKDVNEQINSGKLKMDNVKSYVMDHYNFGKFDAEHYYANAVEPYLGQTPEQLKEVHENFVKAKPFETDYSESAEYKTKKENELKDLVNTRNAAKDYKLYSNANDRVVNEQLQEYKMLMGRNPEKYLGIKLDAQENAIDPKEQKWLDSAWSNITNKKENPYAYKYHMGDINSYYDLVRMDDKNVTLNAFNTLQKAGYHPEVSTKLLNPENLVVDKPYVRTPGVMQPYPLSTPFGKSEVQYGIESNAAKRMFKSPDNVIMDATNKISSKTDELSKDIMYQTAVKNVPVKAHNVIHTKQGRPIIQTEPEKTNSDFGSHGIVFESPMKDMTTFFGNKSLSNIMSDNKSIKSNKKSVQKEKTEDSIKTELIKMAERNEGLAIQVGNRKPMKSSSEIKEEHEKGN